MDSGPTSPPKDAGEEEARAPASPSPRKRRRRTARRLLLVVVRVAIPPPSPPHAPPSPPTPPSDPDPSCHLLEDRRERYQSSVVPFTKGKKTKDRAAFVSSASSSLPFPLSPPFSSFVSYSPCYPTHRRVYYCITPNWLIVVFSCFVRVSGSLALLSKRLIITSRVMCDSIGAVGLRASFSCSPPP